MLPIYRGPANLKLSQYRSPAFESPFHPYFQRLLEIFIVRRLRLSEDFDEVFGRVDFRHRKVALIPIIFRYFTFLFNIEHPSRKDFLQHFQHLCMFLGRSHRP